MVCFNVYNDYIIAREVRRKKFNTEDEALAYIRDTVHDSDPMFMVHSYTGSTEYEICCDLTPYAEEASKHNWFISFDDKNVKLLAAIAVIEREHLWDILMDKKLFDTWLLEKVRW